MRYEYDDQNIFAKILRGEIPNDTVLETEHTLAFNDIGPKAPIHVLVVPKGSYINHDHFHAKATDTEILDFVRVTARVIADKGLSPGAGGDGYRIIGNAGPHGLQEVPHYHLHILGGRSLGAMVPDA